MGVTKSVPLKSMMNEDSILNALDRPEERVKMLWWLCDHPKDKAVTASVIDRVGDFMWDADKEVRIPAVRTYVATLNQNPEISTKMRADRFLGLWRDNDPEVMRMFFFLVSTPIKEFRDELKEDENLKKHMFKSAVHWDLGVRREARDAIQCVFGISVDVITELSKKLQSRFDITHVKKAFERMAGLSDEIDKTKLDKNTILSNLGNIAGKRDDHGNFVFDAGDVMFAIPVAGNLLVRDDDIENYNRCVELGCRVYHELKSRTGAESKEYGGMLRKMFTDWTPDIAREMGYGHLSMGLEELLEEVKRPEVSRELFYESDLLEFLRHGKRKK